MDPIDRVDDCTVERLESDDDLREEVYSLVRYGSFERGDFVPGRSDLDYFVVVDEDEAVVDDLKRILRECTDPISCREVDLAWEYRDNLPDPYEGVPYKFLTIYQDDFRRHHTIVYGADVLPELPEYDFEEVLPSRLDRIERLATEADEDRMLRFLAGEAARLRSLHDGAASLKKADVLETLEERDRTDAYHIYEAYVEGRSDEFDPDFVRRFVADAVRGIRDEIQQSSGQEGE